MKEAIRRFLESKKHISGYKTYKSVLSKVDIDIDLKEIDISGDMLTSERKTRVSKTRAMFSSIENSIDGSQNTKYITINLVKSVLRFIQDNDGMSFWTSYKVEQEYKDIVVLDPEFSKWFVKDGNYDEQTDTFKAMHEIISVMITSTLRISDALNIKFEHISGERIIIKNKKTGRTTISPIPDFLLKRLLFNFKHYGTPYTKMLSRTDCYDLLPEFLSQYEYLKKKVNGRPRYETIKFHVFRKTGITNMLYSNVPQSVIKKASGHSDNSKSFSRYVGFASGLFDQEINKFQKGFYG